MNSSRSRVKNVTFKSVPEDALKVMRKRKKELESTRGKLTNGQYIAHCIFEEASRSADRETKANGQGGKDGEPEGKDASFVTLSSQALLGAGVSPVTIVKALGDLQDNCWDASVNSA